MLELIQRLLRHPSRPHHFLQSRSQEGMMTSVGSGSGRKRPGGTMLQA